MEFFKPGIYIDFMKVRPFAVTLSAVLLLGSITLAFVPGPNYGIDFKGGTEIQLRFRGAINSAELRSALESLNYRSPEVVRVEGKANEYIIRLQEVSTLQPQQVNRLRRSLRETLQGAQVQELKVSPGGDKVSLRLSGAVETGTLQTAFDNAKIAVRSVSEFGKRDDYRYEVYLMGVADELTRGLAAKLGAARAPEQPRRVEWVGPKAGAQLRSAAIKSLLYAIAFIMVYVAFRFDLRFAPGGIIALLHDAIVTLGVFIILQKEVNLSTVAALLTIVGYSINDTIVIYDRIRENMQRMRDKSLRELINVSTSQTISRTILTSSVTALSVIPFLVWGTPVIHDFALALLIGFVSGTYSTVYIAAPVTEWMDKRFFQRA